METGYDRNKHMFTKVTLDQQNKLSGYHPLGHFIIMEIMSEIE